MNPAPEPTPDSLVVFVASRMGELADARAVVRQALRNMHIFTPFYTVTMPARTTRR